MTRVEVEEIGAAYFGCAPEELQISLSRLGWSIDPVNASFEIGLAVGWTSLFVAEPSGSIHQIPEYPQL